MGLITSSLYSKDEVKWSPYQGKKTWQEANDHCQSLNMRLPTITELKIAEETGTTKGWTKNGRRYWAVNRNLDSNNSTYMVLFSGYNSVETHKIDSQLGVYCANVTEKSKQLARNREVEEYKGIVEEFKILEFLFPFPSKFSDFQGLMDWESADKKCKSINMRLPTIYELKDAYISEITESWIKDVKGYWSSTPYDAKSYYVFYIKYGLILFDYGVTYSEDRRNNYGVRCRR